MSQQKFALMIWPTDNNLINVRSLDDIVRPKKLFNDYRILDECLCVYPGFMPGPDEDGLWKAIILATAGTREELKPLQNQLLNESKPLIPKEYTCEMVTKIVIDLALSKKSKETNCQPSSGLDKLPEKIATENKKQKGTKRKSVVNKETPASKDKDTTEQTKKKKQEKSATEQEMIAKKKPMTNKESKGPTASRQRKITKSLETISQDEVFQKLEKDLLSSSNSGIDQDLTSPSTVNTTVAPTAANIVSQSTPVNTSPSTPVVAPSAATIVSQSSSTPPPVNTSTSTANQVAPSAPPIVAKPSPPPVNTSSSTGFEDTMDIDEDFTFSNLSDALRTSTTVLYGTEPTIQNTGAWNEPLSCQGCQYLGSKVECMQHNMNYLWNEVKRQQEIIETELCKRNNICEATSNTQTRKVDEHVVSSSSSSPSAMRNNICGAAANMKTNTQTTKQDIVSPLGSSPSATNQAVEEFESTEKMAQSSQDYHKIYNGYTVEQLESEANKEKDFSKAAKRLLFLMFTEQERAGRCLVDCKKTYKSTGQTILKKGLADQEKLAALQDIVLRCYNVIGGKSEINRKLIEKLKPSASAK